MSASLVGSEMCIRDSLQRVRANQQRAGAKIFLHQRMDLLGDEGHCMGTVSYTHLTLPTICSV
eukprot:10010081-Alexandrium_andersonii.AAC.1